MSYTLSYWIKEPTDTEFRFVSKDISDEEYKRILTGKVIIGFKEGSYVRYFRYVQLSEGEQVRVKKEKRVKQIPVKPYYRKERF